MSISRSCQISLSIMRLRHEISRYSFIGMANGYRIYLSGCQCYLFLITPKPMVSVQAWLFEIFRGFD